jgi:hypothetical protein
VAWLATSTAVLGCKAPLVEPSSPDGTRMESLALTSKSFPSNGDIPVDFTCDGAERSPELTWSAPPPGTKTFALVLEDPDASSGTFTHWIAYNIDPEARELAEGADVGAVSGASGLNDSKRPTYAGPCPPRLEIHHYFFRIYALDAALKVRPEPDRDAIDAAMNGHVLGEGALMFTFSH